MINKKLFSDAFLNLYLGGENQKIVAILTSFNKEWFSVKKKQAEELNQFGGDLNAYQIVGNCKTYRVFDKIK